MWLEMLVNKYPNLALKIKQALQYYVRIIERKAKAPAGSYWYRAFRPNDPEIGGTQRVYTATMTNGAEEHLLAQSSSITVPAANGYVSFGWYIDADFGVGGYVNAKKNTVVKSEIMARLIYEQKDPDHLYLDLDHVIFGKEQDVIDFIFYNAFGADQVCMALPMMFRIASRSSLNLELQNT